MNSILHNILGFLLLFIAIYVLQIFAEPVKRGFFCADSSIRHPYYQEETIGSVAVVAISIALAGILFAVEKYLTSSKRIIKCMTIDFIPFIFGFLINLVISNFVKMITGRLKPCFIEFCKPDTLSQCVDRNSSRLLPGVFVDTFQCTTSAAQPSDFARKSFFSSRASTIAYTSVYLVCYMQNHLSQLPNSFRALAQFLLLTLACIIGFSSLVDYHHFWDDVLVGLFAGSVIAVLTYFNVKPFYDKPITSAFHAHQSPLPAVQQRFTSHVSVGSQHRRRQLFRSKSNHHDSELAPLAEQYEWHSFYETL